MTGQTSEVLAVLLGNVQKTFEREYVRRQTVVMERFWAMLLKERTSDDTSDPDEHEYQQAIEKVARWLTENFGPEGNKKMRENLARELGRQELVDIDRAWGYFKTNASHGMTSESDTCGHEQQCRKRKRKSSRLDRNQQLKTHY